MTTQNPTTNTLAFHGSPVKVINHNGQLWLTSKEVGLCLGYNEANAGLGVRKLYSRNADEFNDAEGCTNLTHPSDTCVIKLATQGGMQDVRLFSQTGCNLLGFFANTPRAKEFRTWAKKVLAGQTPVSAAEGELQQLRDEVYTLRHKLFHSNLHWLAIAALRKAGHSNGVIARILRVGKRTIERNITLIHDLGLGEFLPPAMCAPSIAAHQFKRVLKKNCSVFIKTPL